MTTENAKPAAPAAKPAKPKKQSRADRWNEAIGKARDAHAKAEELAKMLDDAVQDLASRMGDLRGVQEEFEEWQGNLPESLQSTPVGEKLEAVTSIDIDSHTDLSCDVADTLNEISSALDEAENADLPQGFGRD